MEQMPLNHPEFVAAIQKVVAQTLSQERPSASARRLVSAATSRLWAFEHAGNAFNVLPSSGSRAPPQSTPPHGVMAEQR